MADEHIIVDGSQHKTIGAARTAALAQARYNLVAWFDDDDWSHPARLRRSYSWIGTNAVMVGNMSSWIVRSDLQDDCALQYPGYGYIIFNGGVFDTQRMPKQFLECSNGEDVEWVKRGMTQGACVVIPELQHVWLSHQKNAVNHAGRLIFEHTLPGVIEITDEERKLIPA